MIDRQISQPEPGHQAEPLGAIWRKSSYSGTEGSCVQLATNLAGLVAVRDSKHPDTAVLTFAPNEWQAFLRRV